MRLEREGTQSTKVSHPLAKKVYAQKGPPLLLYNICHRLYDRYGSDKLKVTQHTA